METNTLEDIVMADYVKQNWYDFPDVNKPLLDVMLADGTEIRTYDRDHNMEDMLNENEIHMRSRRTHHQSVYALFGTHTIDYGDNATFEDNGYLCHEFVAALASTIYYIGTSHWFIDRYGDHDHDFTIVLNNDALTYDTCTVLQRHYWQMVNHWKNDGVAIYGTAIPISNVDYVPSIYLHNRENMVNRWLKYIHDQKEHEFFPLCNSLAVNYRVNQESRERYQIVRPLLDPYYISEAIGLCDLHDLIENIVTGNVEQIIEPRVLGNL